jgi:hypothetical protein
MLGLDETLHGDRTQIGDVELVLRLEPLDGCRIERDRKPGDGSRPAVVFFITTSSPPIA